MKGPTSVLAKTALPILVAVTGTTSSAVTAPAREGIPREPDLRAYRRLGPFFYSPALRVKALGYEDNVFMDRENPEGDFRATPGACPSIAWVAFRAITRTGSWVTRRCWRSGPGDGDASRTSKVKTAAGASEIRA